MREAHGKPLAPWALASAVAVVGIVLALAGPGAGTALAEPRTVASAHFSAMGFGVDLEREHSGASSWLVGIALDPVGLYAGVRQYTVSAPVHRPFYGAYIGAQARSDPARLEEFEPGLWVSGGYEIRFDRRVRGTGELGFGLVSTGGRISSDVFIGLALGFSL